MDRNGDILFAPIDLGGRLQLTNRIIMLAMTRTRAESDGTPSDLMAQYYAQRASAGLIISESCSVSQTGRTYLNGPGIYTIEHAVGWRVVTDAVHAAGSKMVLQINHTGRVNNLSYLARPIPPVAPSAVRIPRTSRRISVNIPRITPFDVPRELATDEIELLVGDFRRATELASWAGFDGVQIHADSGYLIHQFLSTNVNRRTDRYGGSAQNRARLVLEIVDAVCAVNGPEFVSIKFTPGSPIHDIVEDDVAEKYAYLVDEVNRRRLAFLHLYFADLLTSPDFALLASRRARPLLAEGSLTTRESRSLLKSGHADMVGYGRAFIANPDLPGRIVAGTPLSTPDPETIYSTGPQGYTDYPTWDASDPLGSVVNRGMADLSNQLNAPATQLN